VTISAVEATEARHEPSVGTSDDDDLVTPACGTHIDTRSYWIAMAISACRICKRARRARRNPVDRQASAMASELLETMRMRQTTKQTRLTLSTETIKILDSQHLAHVAGGGQDVTYRCQASTGNSGGWKTQTCP
jgi:hypothetical protein